MPLSYKTKRDVVFMPTEDFLYPWMKIKTLIKYFSDMYLDFNSEKEPMSLSKSLNSIKITKS